MIINDFEKHILGIALNRYPIFYGTHHRQTDNDSYNEKGEVQNKEDYK